jgi:hypothetical protein
VISAPIVLNTDSGSNVAAGATLTLSGEVKGNGSIQFTKTGDGMLAMSNVRLATVNVNDNGTLAILANGTASGTSVVQSLNLSGGPVPSASLDLTNNGLVIDYSGSSPADTVKAQIIHAFNGGAWNSSGIGSSTAATIAAGTSNHKTAVGYAEAASLGIGSFMGQSIDGNAVVVRYTYCGDANLDGAVNSADFSALAGNFNGQSKLWLEGDFNFDGNVNALDFNYLATNFGQPALAAPLGSLVPEPIGLSVLAAAIFGLTRRSRH